jgi:anaerobic selenocysteine-containing dehydrogenase
MDAAAIHHRTCNLCEAMCGLRIELDGDRIRSIRGDPDDPFSRGFVCPKATALEDVHLDPDRQKHALRRTPEGWAPLGWTEAFDEVASRLRDLQARHGPESVALYLGNPNVHSLGALTHGLPFIRALRTHNRYSATSVDQLPHHFAAAEMFGHMLLLPVPDIDRTQFFLALGANPLASNGSMMTAPGFPGRLKALKARGGRLVVVDPRRTETAALADTHLFIRPSTDALFLAALVHTILEEGLERLDRLAAFTEGLPALRLAVARFSPERVADVTSIPAETVRRLARDFARAESAVAYGRVGVSTQAYGGLAQWLLTVLNVITGNLDRPGGALFARPAINPLGLTPRGNHGRHRSRVRSLPSFGGEFPVATLAEEIETEARDASGVWSWWRKIQLRRPTASTSIALARRLRGGDRPYSSGPPVTHMLLPPRPRCSQHYDVVFPSRGPQHGRVTAALPCSPGCPARLGDLPRAHLAVEGRRSPASACRARPSRPHPRRMVDLDSAPARLAVHRLSVWTLERLPSRSRPPHAPPLGAR